MKILLDECVTKKLKLHLSGFDVVTVTELGLSGIKNGKLMSYCSENEIDILLTIDKNLMYQQNLEKYKTAIVVFNTTTSKINEILLFLPQFLNNINSFEKHNAYLLEK